MGGNINEGILLLVVKKLVQKISKETGLSENESNQVLINILTSKEVSNMILDKANDKEYIRDLFGRK